MWKVLLLLACVASFTIVYCDDSTDSSNDDLDGTDTSYRARESFSKKSKSSSSSSSLSSSSSSLSSLSSKSSKSSQSSASMSSSSESESFSKTKTTDYTSKKQQSDDCDDSNASSNASDASGAEEVDTTAGQGSEDVNTSDGSLSQSNDNPSDYRTPAYRCGPNQVFSNCTNGGCDARNCSQAGKPVACVKLNPKSCIKGCVCQSGYLRAKNGTCLPRNQCNEGCGSDSNAHPGCGVNCGKTCSTYKIKNPICILVCNENGCDCNNGYVYDPAVSKCVLPDDCTPVCGVNEIASNCSNGGCGPFTCSDLGSPVKCVRPAKCTKGCVCQNEYVRNENGTCVPKDQCTGGCGGDPNAKSGCGVNCGKTCSTYKAKSPICPRICKVNGCDCNDGYVYDPAVSKCVLPDDCTPVCGVNEIASNCSNGGCGPFTCSDIGNPVKCVKPIKCTKGCVCQNEYVRNENGTCVPKDQCTGGCGGDPNAKSGCGVNCGKTCSTYKAKNPICPRICKVNACDCKDNFVYDSNVGKCVLPQECTPTCGLNEQYSSCTNGGCGYKNCSQIGQPELCVDPALEYCIKGCICASGYLRASNGTCVPQDQCPGGCGGDPNAQPGCGYNCGKTCSTYKVKKPLCPRIVCKPDKCDCKDNYVFDSNVKKCVLPKDCTPICGLNEMYSSCTNGGCDRRNCSQLGKPQICIDRTPESCIKGCVCVTGYLRAANGTCVPQDKCPATGCNGDRNAHSGCGVNCGRTCDTYKLKNVACPAICELNGCDCNDGYVFDATVKKCVLPNDCKKCNKPNEVYDVCPAPCPPRRCNVDPSVIRCAAPPQPGDPKCQAGCRCADGYARNATGTCVLRKQCEKPLTCNKNEVYDSCPAPCPGDSCDVDPALVLCTPGPTYGDPACKPACRCIDGYARNAANQCVPRDQCQKCNKPNEVYDACPGPCPLYRCDVDPRVIKCAAPPQPGDPNCQSGCRCADGYARNATGTCVLRKKCEKPLTCNKNEVYDSCPAPCPGDSCDVNPALVSCTAGPTYGDPACKPACRCIDGYARNAANECVPRDQCPPSPSDQCSGQNEFYDTCISGCSNQSCADIGKIFHCPIQPAVCRTGCRCKPGYYRNADNTCVPQSQCPSPPNDQCSGQNEFFDTCISGCSNQTCDEIGKIYNCPIQPAVCRTGCRCSSGFYRNSDNACVPESQCPAPPCPEGEVYSRCPAVKCDAEYCPKDRNSPLTCPIGIVCDPPRCVCGFNRHRDRKTNKCIATSSCPPFKCNGKNEVYKSCPAVCPGENCTDYINSSKCPPYRIGIVVPCKPQCKCKDGYFRNSDGVCILGSQCGPKATTSSPAVVPSDTTTATPTTTVADDNNGGDSTNALANLQAGITSFSGKFLYDRIKAGKGQNIIASPFSVFTPMAQLALYATGESLKQLLSLLNVSSSQDIRSAFPDLASSYDGQTSANFSLAAKVYSDNKYPLNPTFIKDSIDVVRADAQVIDFSQNVQAAATVNAWVESKTNNRIKDLIKPSDLSELTRLVLVNAIYFKGQWENLFKKENTQDADFYLSDGTTKKTKLMYQEAQFNYGEVPELNITVLEMYYKGRNFSMVVVLPNDKDGIMQATENLQSPANVKKVLGSLRSQKVKVYIPPFEINTETDLSVSLQQVGVTKIFDCKDSGINGILATEEKICVSKAVQKAFIKVDEYGSEAAAANGVGVERPRPGPPPPPPVEFRADRAFLFYIRLQGTTMFCGAYVQ